MYQHQCLEINSEFVLYGNILQMTRLVMYLWLCKYILYRPKRSKSACTIIQEIIIISIPMLR